jgi:hypothetical protein
MEQRPMLQPETASSPASAAAPSPHLCLFRPESVVHGEPERHVIGLL